MKRGILLLILLLGFVFASSNICAQQSLAEKYKHEAMEYFKRGDMESVVTSCKKAIEIDPNYTEAYFVMGRAYTILNKLKDAIVILEKVLNINPKYGYAHFALGEAYRSAGEFQNAISSLEKALDAEPDNKELSSAVYVTLAVINMRSGQFKEAITYLEKAKSLNVEFAEVYVHFGAVYRFLNQLEKAKESYQKGISVYRSQGLEGFANKYEKKLNYIENSYVEVYLKREKTTMYKGVIIEDTDNYLRLKGDLYMNVSGGFIMGQGGEQKIDKKDIDHIELEP